MASRRLRTPPPLSLREGTNAMPPANTQTGLPAVFTMAYNAAVSRATALVMRVTLGDIRGARVEYSTDNGLTFIPAIDTTASGPDQVASGLAIGFAGPAGYGFIDDIGVENDDNVAPMPTPTPSPPLLPATIWDLSQHFNQPNASLEYWQFVPDVNVQSVDMEKHPGLTTIRENGLGQDIKGILSEAIPINKYPLPWEFQLCLPQNFNVLVGAAPGQLNTAIGLNVAVTFFDPSTWPQDRTSMPPNTHSYQLMDVHLGSAGNDLPQLVNNPNIYRTTDMDNSPEAYLVWGRGDLPLSNSDAMGHWKVPYVWIGDGAKYAGPASSQIYYRCVVLDPTHLSVSIKFNASHGWHTRIIDCSRFGQIKGIWQIGPGFSGDRWIPDTLAPALGVSNTPVAVATPDPALSYHVDYCVFLNSPPIPFEQLSDDFNIPGYLGQWITKEQCAIMERYSNPGYMTWTLLGPSLPSGMAHVSGDLMNISLYPPPWEIEICVSAPDDGIPWNFYMNFAMRTNLGRGILWYPGVQNFPSQSKHSVTNANFNVVFDPPAPESILSHKPSYMLVQWIDLSHVRLAFKANAQDAWYFSQIFDYSTIMHTSETISGNLIQSDWSTTSGSEWGGLDGCPIYQKFMIDYVHYRYGLTSDNQPQAGGIR
jgi:hypothetical protein